MVGALRCQLLGILIAQRDCRRHEHHEKGIDPESHAEATDLGIRCLLSMAAELSAVELSAKLAAILADLPVLVLVYISVVMP